MPPIVNEDFSLPEAIQWLIQVTKSAGLPGIKPYRQPTSQTVSVVQAFKPNQTLGVKYKRYNSLFSSLVAQFELTPGWSSIPSAIKGKYIFINSNSRIQVTLSQVIGTGKIPSAEFQIDVTDLKPKVIPLY